MKEESQKALDLLIVACESAIQTPAYSFRICRNGHIGGGYDETACCKLGALDVALDNYRKSLKKKICQDCDGIGRAFDPKLERNGVCYNCDGLGEVE